MTARNEVRDFNDYLTNIDRKLMRADRMAIDMGFSKIRTGGIGMNPTHTYINKDGLEITNKDLELSIEEFISLIFLRGKENA